MPTNLALQTFSQPLPTSRMTAARPLASDFLTAVNRDLLRFTEVIETWAARHEQRRALHALSDDLLQDIGRSRADVAAEADKPFWRA
jgi:uncharacterized protein YjiS (DUF1127 family)